MAETVTYEVQAGDNLSKIAKKYGTTWQKLAELNNIPGPKYTIYIGQTLVISGDPVKETTSASNRPVITHFGRVSTSDREMYVAWTWKHHNNTQEYQVQWCYSYGIGVPFYDPTTTTEKTAFYGPPDKAPLEQMKVSVKIKPISKKYKDKNGVEHDYFVADWSTKVLYEYKNEPPKTPSAPSVEIKDYQLTATLDGLEDLNATSIEFHVYSMSIRIMGTCSLMKQSQS